MKTDSTAPAPPSKCPVIDLVAVTTTLSSASPNADRIALYSAISPTGVDVACAFTWQTSEALALASFKANFMALDAPAPSGSGAAM